MGFAGKITYNSIDVDFVREWNEFVRDNRQTQVINEAASGVEEISNFFDRDFITARKRLITAQEIMEVKQFYEYAKDGSTFELWRDSGLGAYIPFEGKSLKDNSENAGTFTRTNVTNSASYVDPSTGLVTFAGAADTPRFPAGKFGRGFLIEGARVNRINRSEDLTHVDWVSTNITDSAYTGFDPPLSGAQITKLEATANNGTHAYDSAETISTNSATFTVWVRTLTGNVSFQLNINSTSVGQLETSGTLTATPTWQRFVVTTVSPGGAGNFEYEILVETSGDIIYATLAQGEHATYPTEYIQANGGTDVTRNSESLTYATSNVLEANQGTIMFWYAPQYDITKLGSLLYLFQSGVDQTAPHLEIVADNASDSIDVNVYDADGTARIAMTSGALIDFQFTFKHIAVTWDCTTANSAKLYIDGAVVETDTYSAFVPDAVGTNYSIGSELDTTSHGDGVYDDFLIRKDVLSDAQISTIYNAGRAIAEQHNYWSAARLVDPAFNPVRRVGTNRFDLELIMKESIS